MTIAGQTAVKFATFDRSIVKRNWKNINKTPLQQAGMKTRGNARGSIRRGTGRKRNKATGKLEDRPTPPKNKRKPSSPGRPPKSWKTGKTPPFKMIYSVPNKLGTSVVVGMVGFGKAPGSTMPVPGLMEHGGTAKRKLFVETRIFKHKHTRKTSGKYAKAVIRRKPAVRQVKYPERAFMNPALKKVRKKFPQYWRGAFNPGRVKSTVK